MKKLALSITVLMISMTASAIECMPKKGIDEKVFEGQEVFDCGQVISSSGEKEVQSGSFICIQKLYSRNLKNQKDRLYVSLNLNDDFVIEDEGFGDLEMSFYAKKNENGSLSSGIDLSRGTPEDKFKMKLSKDILEISKNIDELTINYKAKFKCKTSKIKYSNKTK